MSARSVAASYKPPMLVTRVRLPACAFPSCFHFAFRPMGARVRCVWLRRLQHTFAAMNSLADCVRINYDECTCVRGCEFCGKSGLASPLWIETASDGNLEGWREAHCRCNGFRARLATCGSGCALSATNSQGSSQCREHLLQNNGPLKEIKHKCPHQESNLGCRGHNATS